MENTLSLKEIPRVYKYLDIIGPLEINTPSTLSLPIIYINKRRRKSPHVH